MRRVEATYIQGVTEDQPGRISVQFRDPSGQEWAVEVATLEMIVLGMYLNRAIEEAGVDFQELEAEARQKYEGVIRFPDS